MKLDKDFEMRSLAGQHIIVPVTSKNVDFTHILSLNETAANIWQIMEKGDFTVETIVNTLTQEYDVTPEQARSDVEAFIKQLQEVDIVKE